jgi:hypothetical protein
LLRAERSALLDLHRDGIISDETLEKLTAEVDAALLSDTLSDKTLRTGDRDPPADELPRP